MTRRTGVSFNSCLMAIPNQQYPERPSERVKLQIKYAKLFDRVYRQTGMDLSDRAPRAWPEPSFLTDNERKL